MVFVGKTSLGAGTGRETAAQSYASNAIAGAAIMDADDGDDDNHVVRRGLVAYRRGRLEQDGRTQTTDMGHIMWGISGVGERGDEVRNRRTVVGGCWGIRQEG